MDTPQRCAVCGNVDCTVPGLHGMIRDRARLAVEQRARARTSPWVQRAQARNLPAKELGH